MTDTRAQSAAAGMANISQRANPAQQLASAREKIVAEMDRLQQRIANMDAKEAAAREAIGDLVNTIAVMRAEEAGLRTALAAIGPAATKGRRANGAAKVAPATKLGRKFKAAIPAPAGVAAMPGNGDATDP